MSIIIDYDKIRVYLYEHDLAITALSQIHWFHVIGELTAFLERLSELNFLTFSQKSFINFLGGIRVNL